MDHISQCSNTSTREAGVEEWLDEEDPFHLPAERSVNSFLGDCEFITVAEESDFSRTRSISKAQDTLLLHERIRKKLVYHFMNPVEKWKAKRRFPWKLCVQIVKILFITLQMTLFGFNSHDYVKRHQEVTIALGHIFLLDWTPNFASYPPSAGPYSVFTIEEFYANIDNVIRQYAKVSTFPIGSFSYNSPNGTMTPLQLCLERYKSGKVLPYSATVNIINIVEQSCINIPVLYPEGDPAWEKFSFKDFLPKNNVTLNFETLLQIKLSFALRTIILKSLSHLDIPECYKLYLNVVYNNRHHDGQMKISFTVDAEKVHCNVHFSHVDSVENKNYAYRQLLSCVVIIVCAVSSILCIRSLYASHRLKIETITFFKTEFDIVMSVSEQFDFIDLWYVMIVVSDILVICGSSIKIQIEDNHQNRLLYSQCCMLLGIGNLLVWAGILRYLGFFKKYNMLILTVKCALPNVLRFLLCAVFLYAGFCFCGWIVLGPYHIKFESLSRTSECLFAVMNGDDMFATFALLNDEDNPLLWWFSRAYLYTFLVLFVYVVISLFISVIMDTFETIKFIYIHGTPPKTAVELFIYGELPKPKRVPQHVNCTEKEQSTVDLLKTVFIKILSRLKSQTQDSQLLPNPT